MLSYSLYIKNYNMIVLSGKIIYILYVLPISNVVAILLKSPNMVYFFIINERYSCLKFYFFKFLLC